MGSPNERVPKSLLKQWVKSGRGGCMDRNCCKPKIKIITLGQIVRC